jgi:hypothetical protein
VPDSCTTTDNPSAAANGKDRIRKDILENNKAMRSQTYKDKEALSRVKKQMFENLTGVLLHSYGMTV